MGRLYPTPFRYPVGMTKTYDRAYFDRWYRDPVRRVRTPAQLRRKVAMVVGVTEHLIDRRLSSVLDVGCGEAEWGFELRRLRPRAHYRGIDPSEYAVRRFGRSRNIRRGTFSELDEMATDRAWDLIVCSDVLHYVPDDEVTEALHLLALVGESVLFIDVMTREDEPLGDTKGFLLRPAAWYRERLEEAGLVSVGMQCYVGSALREGPVELEKP